MADEMLCDGIMESGGICPLSEECSRYSTKWLNPRADMFYDYAPWEESLMTPDCNAFIQRDVKMDSTETI